MTPFDIILAARTVVRLPRRQARVEAATTEKKKTVQLDEDAVDFLMDVLPKGAGAAVCEEDSRRRLGGDSLHALADQGYVVEFSHPKRDGAWNLIYAVRVMRRVDCGVRLELLAEKTVYRDLQRTLQLACKQLGIATLHPRRNHKKESAGMFDHELGLTGRLLCRK